MVTHWLKRFLSIVQSNYHTQKIDTHFKNSAEPSMESRLTLSALRLGEGVRRPTQISNFVGDQLIWWDRLLGQSFALSERALVSTPGT